MYRLCFGTCVSVICLFGPSVFAVPGPDDAEALVASRSDVVKANRNRGIEGVYIAMRKIREAYRVPINFEWSYVHADRSGIDDRTFKFNVREGDSLRLTLDRFCEETGGILQWRRIHDVICVWPTGKGGVVESTLDAKVSLEVKELSTWEALLEIARLVNQDIENTRVLMPDAEPRQDQYTPPLALREAKGITLSMEDVTAREAICAIMAASPLPVEFTYGNYYRPNLPNPLPPSSTVSLRAYDANGETLYHIPPSKSSPENYVWTNEAREVAVKPDPSSAADPNP